MTDLFIIEKASPITQFQDLGRFNNMHWGLSHSGPMDETAFAINNQLLGNDENATQLEIAPGGLTLRALADCHIAISGAYLLPTLNKEPLINFCTHAVKKEDILAFGFAKLGQYAYIAVSGGFSSPSFLNSTSTTKRLQITPSGELKKQSILSGGTGLSIKLTGEPRKNLPDYRSACIDIIPAYQYDGFSKKNRQRLTEQSFTVINTDRMGTKVSAEKAIKYSGGELLSEGIIPGAVQIPPNGQPIILQKDAQSIGGYPKIGVVTAKSRSLLAQMQKGRTFYFRFIESPN